MKSLHLVVNIHWPFGGEILGLGHHRILNAISCTALAKDSGPVEQQLIALCQKFQQQLPGSLVRDDCASRGGDTRTREGDES